MERTFTVYMHKTPNGKVYIGQTGQKNPKSRWNEGYQHSPYFHNAILKYGWENIESTIIATGLSPEEADELEQKLIAEHRSNNREFGYNIEGGGSKNKNHTEEAKRKISEASKRCWKDPEFRARVIAANKGKVVSVSEETKEILREKSIKRMQDPKVRDKISQSTKKQFEDPEARKRVSEFHKSKWQDSEYRAMMCEKRKTIWDTPGYREKMSSAHKKEDHPEVGQRLKELRGERSASKVAKDIGVSKSIYRRYEKGEVEPKDEIKLRIAKYFETTVEDVFISNW